MTLPDSSCSLAACKDAVDGALDNSNTGTLQTGVIPQIPDMSEEIVWQGIGSTINEENSRGQDEDSDGEKGSDTDEDSDSEGDTSDGDASGEGGGAWKDFDFSLGGALLVTCMLEDDSPFAASPIGWYGPSVNAMRVPVRNSASFIATVIGNGLHIPSGFGVRSSS